MTRNQRNQVERELREVNDSIARLRFFLAGGERMSANHRMLRMGVSDIERAQRYSTALHLQRRRRRLELQLEHGVVLRGE